MLQIFSKTCVFGNFYRCTNKIDFDKNVLKICCIETANLIKIHFVIWDSSWGRGGASPMWRRRYTIMMVAFTKNRNFLNDQELIFTNEFCNIFRVFL